MMTQNPSLDLVEFIETQILPQYTQFDKAHNMEHVTRVIRSSLDLARKTGADLNMAYAIAAYHDLGLSGPRAIHHLTSGKILIADGRPAEDDEGGRRGPPRIGIQSATQHLWQDCG